METTRHQFKNSEGHLLEGRLDVPSVGNPSAYALFSHCFTCSKNIRAIIHISEALTELGIAVFRFDFPGLGDSEGSFSETTFSSNVDDLYRAALYMEDTFGAPQILIGHSLGGAAAIRAARAIHSVNAVVTIGAPADPAHVTHMLEEKRSEIQSFGEAKVSIAKREFVIKQEFIDDLESISMGEATRKLGKALLILHSPVDEIVEISNAAEIYKRALHPKSFLSLDEADHMLSNAADSRYAARTLAAWSERYTTPADDMVDSETVIARIGQKGFRTEILANGHRYLADEPLSFGGTDEGPAPYDFLLSGLGACTAMTLRMYADHKKLPVSAIEVHLTHAKEEAPEREAGKQDVIRRLVSIEGTLTEKQRARMLEIADRCPVHKTLESKVKILTEAG